MWVDATHRRPTKQMNYRIKMSTGSMSRNIVETKGVYNLNTGKFLGEFDWNYVTEWWEEDQEKKTLKIKLKL